MMTDTVTSLANADGSRKSTLASGGSQKVAIVNGSPDVLALAENVLTAGHYDVVFIESIDRAYSQIRQSAPQVVVLCLDVDDAAGFQILTMLRLDSTTSEIPIITYIAPPSIDSPDQDSIEVDNETLSQAVVLSMN